MPATTHAEDRIFVNRALEASIRIGFVALLVLWCFQVARPLPRRAPDPTTARSVRRPGLRLRFYL